MIPYLKNHILHLYYRTGLYRWLCKWKEVKHTVEVSKRISEDNLGPILNTLGTREATLKYYNTPHSFKELQDELDELDASRNS